MYKRVSDPVISRGPATGLFPTVPISDARRPDRRSPEDRDPVDPEWASPRTLELSAPGGVRPEHPAPVAGWERRYETAVMCCDLVCLLAATAIVTFGYHSPADIDSLRTLIVVVASVVVACLSLMIQKVWDRRVLGSGSEEYARIVRAYVFAVAALAVVGYAKGTSAGQSWILGALTLSLILTLGVRRLLRTAVRRARKQGRCLRSVLVSGDADEIHELAGRATIMRESGWRIDGICLADSGLDRAHPVAIDDVPVLGSDDDIVELTELHRFDAVALLPSCGWPHSRTRRLSWELERIGADLLIAPVLMDVVGPRLHIAPMSGLPLLQMSAPRYSGPAWAVKNVLDRVLALSLLVVISPLLAAVAIGIRAGGPGPILFRQTRVGRDGRCFTMYKFRSMVVDAEQRLADVADRDDGAGVLFKIKDDPRVTRFGRFIRRYSLDELPQLFNVVRGDMSLVGPRPPLESEAASYGDDGAVRRLFVKPGLTGLWQVSGRSDLSWEESVRADLRYVENWTFAMDLSILCRTAGAVLRSNGAY